MITGTFNVTGAGFSGAPPTGVALYKYSPAAKLAWIFLPGISGTSNSTSFSIGPLPSFLMPASIASQQNVLEGFDNGTEQGPLASLILLADSSIHYLKNGQLTGWTASSTKGVGLQVLTLFLD